MPLPIHVELLETYQFNSKYADDPKTKQLD